MNRKKWLSFAIIFTLLFQIITVPLASIKVTAEITDIYLKRPDVQDNTLRIIWEVYGNLDPNELEVNLVKNGEAIPLQSGDFLSHFDVLEGEELFIFEYLDAEVDLEENYSYYIEVTSAGVVMESNVVYYDPAVNGGINHEEDYINELFYLEYSISGNFVDLEWDVPFSTDHIAKFEILLNGNKIGTVERDEDSFFRIENLDPSTTYRVEVVAIDYDDQLKNTTGVHRLTTKNAASGEIVIFDDDKLEEVVRSTLEIGFQDLRESDLLELTNLNVSWRNITSLNGLEYATNLTRFDGYGNSITDISPLSNLEKLEYVGLSENQIENISPLKNLKNLKWLYLEENIISNISVLLELDSLEELNLRRNPIDFSLESKTMDIIEELAVVRQIDVYAQYPFVNERNITDATMMLTWFFDGITTDMDSYQINVNGVVQDTIIYDKYVSQIYTLAGLNPETEYQVYIIGLKDGTPIAKTKTITVTTSPTPTGSDVVFVDSKLEEQVKEQTGIYHRNIKEDDMVKLSDFFFSSSDITDLTGLEAAINLIELGITGPVTNLEGISNMKELEYLYLTNVGLSDFTVLTELPNLQDLYLSNNNISDLTSLKDLASSKKLLMLNLSNNNISNLNGIEQVPNLTALLLANNKIDNLTPLKELKKLRHLSFPINKVEDITPLLSFEDFSSVTMWGNLLDFTEGSATSNVVQELKNNSVWIEMEEPSGAVISEVTTTSITLDLEAMADGKGYDRFSIFLNGIFIEDADNSKMEYVIEGLKPDSYYEIIIYLGFGERDSDQARGLVKTLPQNEEQQPTEPIDSVDPIEPADPIDPVDEGDEEISSPTETTKVITEDFKQVERDSTVKIQLRDVAKVYETVSLSAQQMKELKEKNVKLELDRGDVTVQIPVNNFPSIDKDITVSIRENEAEVPDKEKALSSIYSFEIMEGNEKLTTFEESITLTFKLNYVEDSSKNLKIFYYDGEKWVNKDSNGNEYGGTISQDGQYITGATKHFSTFAVFEVEELNTPETDRDSTDEHVSEKESSEQQNDEDIVQEAPQQNKEDQRNNQNNAEKQVESDVLIGNQNESNKESSQAGKDNKLPVTSTNIFTLLMIGTLLLLAGAMLLFFQKRKIKFN